MDTSDTRRWQRRLWFALAAILAVAWVTAFPGWAQDADKTGETSAALPAASDSAPSQPGAGITPTTDAPTQENQPDEPKAAGAPKKSPPPTVPKAELASFGYAFFSRAPTTYAPITDTPVPPNYGLGPGDTLKISFWSAIGQETTVTRAVDASGRIDLPLLGTITARGLTLSQFEAMVLREYGRQFHQIRGRVTLDHLRSLQVMVAGEAQRPGLYTISALSTAFNALYQAGGPTARGSMRQVALIRNNRQIATLDLYDYLLTGRRVQDYRLEPGDTLFIPVVGPVVGIKGWVKRPALYELKGGERLRDLIAMAGGIRASTYLKLVQIERIRAHSERVLADVDVAALLDGDDTHNLELRDGDLISVGTVLDKRANGVEITGKVARPGLFELKPGMRVKDLLAAAQGTVGEVDFGRAEVFRIEPDQTSGVIPFDLGKALAGDPEANLLLQPGDKVMIYLPEQVQRRRKVSIEGPVQRPGAYDRGTGMRVADLIYAAGGLGDDAYPDRADLVRVRPDETNEAIPIDLRALKDPRQNLELADRDRLRIFRLAEVEWRNRAVSISGALQRPGTFERTEGMTLRELIFQAGNVLPNAAGRAEVSRARGTQDTNVLVADLDRLLKQNDLSADVALQDGDKVLIPEVGNYLFTPETVTLGGEVRYPGAYALQGKHERLSHLIERAGGLTEYAFPEGALFTRRTDNMITPPQAEVASRVQQKAAEHAERQYQLELARAGRDQPRPAGSAVSGSEKAPAAAVAAAQAAGATAAEPVVISPPKAAPSILPSGRIPLDLKAVLANPHGDADLVLENGDALAIPRRPTTVVVAGSVVSPGAIAYGPGRGIDYYVTQCGGYDEDASSGRTVVLRANGTVLPRREVREVQLGDVVIVPSQAVILRDRNKWDDLGKALSVVADAATSFFLIREAAR